MLIYYFIAEKFITQLDEFSFHGEPINKSLGPPELFRRRYSERCHGIH